jgi:hypothetical protein
MSPPVFNPTNQKEQKFFEICAEFKIFKNANWQLKLGSNGTIFKNILRFEIGYPSQNIYEKILIMLAKEIGLLQNNF